MLRDLMVVTKCLEVSTITQSYKDKKELFITR